MLRLNRPIAHEGRDMSSDNQNPLPATEDHRADAAPLMPAKVDGELDLRHIRDALRGLRYGTVSVIVQDGVIVQIDRTEKRRVRR